jgi:DNA-binding IclR family transcriptional regulator
MVLELLAASKDGMTSSQLSSSLGLSRTIVYRLVGTLIDHGLVRRYDNGMLGIGLAALRLTENLFPMLREVARPVLERLSEDLSSTAHFSVADGNDSLAIQVVEPRNTTFHLAYRNGSRHPLGLGALGKALVAAKAGQHGVFESHGELIAGATGVAAAVPGLPGLSGAVGIVTLTPLTTRVIGPRVQAAADELVAAITSAGAAEPAEPQPVKPQRAKAQPTKETSSARRSAGRPTSEAAAYARRK